MTFQKKFYIAGVQHHQLHTVLGDLEEGDRFSLVRDPTNQFDPNAVRIEAEKLHFGDEGAEVYECIMCGFVPKKFSAEVSAALEIGTELECVITKLDKQAKPWEQCEVEVRELEDESTP